MKDRDLLGLLILLGLGRSIVLLIGMFEEPPPPIHFSEYPSWSVYETQEDWLEEHGFVVQKE